MAISAPIDLNEGPVMTTVLPFRVSAKVSTTSLPVVLRLKDGMAKALLFDFAKVDCLEDIGVEIFETETEDDTHDYLT